MPLRRPPARGGCVHSALRVSFAPMDRARSFWGWGYEDRFPDEDARRGIAAHVGGLLGRAFSPRPAPRLEDLRLPAPRVTPPPELAAFAYTDARTRASH